MGLFDVRQGAECLALCRLHERACYGASFLNLPHLHLNNCLLSFSADATVKAWDLNALQSEGGMEQSPIKTWEAKRELSEVLACVPHNSSSSLILGGTSAQDGPSFLGVPIITMNLSAATA